MAEHIALGVDLGWQHGAKQGIGTAAARDSKVWFTIAKGALSEVYFPRIDSACLRDLKLVVVGPGFIHDEQRDMHNEIARPEPRALAYCITSRGPDYVLTKEICTDPKGDALLIRVRFAAPKTHRLVLIATPRLGNRGAGGNAGVEQGGDPAALRAWRDDLHVCLLADRPWRAATCGYTGPDDPWYELARHGRLVSQTTHAANAHVVLAAELDCSPQRELRLAVGFGRHEAKAFWSAQQALGRPFPQVWAEYCAGWRQAAPDLSALGRDRPDGGRQAQLSAMLLLALEDKQHQGACIASPSVPWGEARDDHERGGYHLVWPRDLCKIGQAALATGQLGFARRILRFLAGTQQPDGHWAQCMWVDGTPYWQGIQLDETALPVIFAYQMREAQSLDFDPWPMVEWAARFLLERGPRTEQERWEENGGYSPSTLAAAIAALVCAATFADDNGAARTARYWREIADSWNEHVEAWCFARRGALGHSYYQRIVPAAREDVEHDGALRRRVIEIRNLDPGRLPERPPQEIVDGGFLDLVRFGLRHPHDLRIERSIAVCDRHLKVSTPAGDGWHRYNGDGYGETEAGEPFRGRGVGRAWPLLTGERGHYELIAGRDAGPYLDALERFANDGGMLPEQVWDEADRPELGLYLGRGTGAATPLGWAHAEYLSLLASTAAQRAWPRLAACVERYLERRPPAVQLDSWSFGHPIRRIEPAHTLRIHAEAPFVLHYGVDDWQSVADRPATPLPFGLWYIDLTPADLGSAACVDFTFFWPRSASWEQRDFRVLRSLEPGDVSMAQVEAPERPAV